ncbi:MAG: hypothetical protein FH749_14360 [Firmicutes bacterium]|nr:hypothetical protein [Bacillota bacterium]
MTKWKFLSSYKYDLAAFCNLFTLDSRYQELHNEAWQRFQPLIEDSAEHTAFAQQLNQSGVLVSSALSAIFDSYEYNGDDIDELCRVLDDSKLLQTRLRDYFLDTGILTAETWEAYKPMMPAFSALAKYAHNNGFAEWWHKRCLPEIEERCAEFERNAESYPVLEAINSLLGRKYALPHPQITVYVCKYSAPNGTSLINQSFVTDLRWPLKTTVPIALHEMMHPPFDRHRITEIAESLVADELVIAARARLAPGNYSTPLFFVEENIVEAAHIYLAEQMGLEDNPLQYFIDHDNATHVLSPLIYTYLKRWQAGDELSLEQAVERMAAEGILEAGKIKSLYNELYAQAGISHPYK